MAHNLDADILINAAAYDAVRGMYRADRLPTDLINAMDLDSAVYRMDHKQALIGGPDAMAPSSGDGSSPP
jgi:hypothetical protein